MLRLVLLLCDFLTTAVWPVKDEDGAKAVALTTSKRKSADTTETKEFMFDLVLSNEGATIPRILVVEVCDSRLRQTSTRREKEHVSTFGGRGIENPLVGKF